MYVLEVWNISLRESSDKYAESEKEGPIDSLEHIKLDCLAFKELRSQYDLSDDLQLTQLFQSVVEHRKERGEDWESWVFETLKWLNSVTVSNGTRVEVRPRVFGAGSLHHSKAAL